MYKEGKAKTIWAKRKGAYGGGVKKWVL